MRNKDWTGNYNSIYKTIAASNHCDSPREDNDYYATEPKATELLLENEKFNSQIWECACGQGHISEVLSRHGYDVISTDLVNRGYGKGNINFLNESTDQIVNSLSVRYDIITNPPYKFAKEFVERALDLINDGCKVAMFLKLTFLEGKARKALFLQHPPKIVYVSSSRLKCAKNGDFKSIAGSAVAYAWYVWEKGYKGNTIIKWIN
jgi:hypothetical protein